MTLQDRNSAFGAKILELRTALGISQRKLGEQVGLSSGFLSRLERGLYDPPSEEKIVALANVLRTNPDALLGLAGKTASDVTAQIVKQPEKMSESVRQLSMLSEDSLPWILSAVAIFALAAMKAKEQPQPSRTEEYKRRWREAFGKFRKEISHFSTQEQRDIITEMKRLIIDWDKALNERL